MTRDEVDMCVADGLRGTPYRPIARIGVGTSAEVFEVEGPGGARRALKLLRTIHMGTSDAAFRLEQEARALAALHHPNLVRVLDAGVTADGRPYFAMPRLQGETLRERLLRSGAMAPARACALFAGLLDGLGAAHAAGIIHRDLKPANIFLVPRAKPLGAAPAAPAASATAAASAASAASGAPIEERCVLIDFGIAKFATGPGAQTTGAHILGTPRYLAPEQILGGRVDARTDVYAAGLVLFEMIARRSPYDGEDSIELMKAHVGVAPRRLQSLARVTPELDHAIARALHKAPSRRWPSARAFAEVLSRASVRERAAEVSR